MLSKIKQGFMVFATFLTAGLQAKEVDQLKSSADAALAWVGIIDQGKYEEAWQKGSLTLQLRVPLKSWLAILEATRKPLGNAMQRKLVNQKPAQNPQGLPAGDYMVIVYKTDFASRKDVQELVTLVLQSDGEWRGLTYQVE